VSEEQDPQEILDHILEIDGRYPRRAYLFVMEAVSYTVEKLPERRHITGKELSLGIRDFAIERFGIAAKLVFEEWNITKTRQFGDIVFNLVNEGLLRKTEEDAIEDFDEVFDFTTAFEVEYEIDVEPKGS
jgi:uncharacterized repeat protein (TIGR04138 family)